MDLIKTITSLICYLDSFPIFIIILLTLIIFKKYDLFFTTSIVLTSSSLINCVLKLIFKVPLLPSVGHLGYAFPSGHTQMATVFFGWLAIHHILKKSYFLIIILMIGISIYVQNYHTPIEIIGGFITGLGVLILFNQTPILKYPSIVFTVSSLLIFYILIKQYYIQFFLTIYSCNILLLLFFFKLKSIHKNKKKS